MRMEFVWMLRTRSIHARSEEFVRHENGKQKSMQPNQELEPVAAEFLEFIDEDFEKRDFMQQVLDFLYEDEDKFDERLYFVEWYTDMQHEKEVRSNEVES
jgi:uncharacterized protein with von Willebrand factor type A (vWA) domain